MAPQCRHPLVTIIVLRVTSMWHLHPPSVGVVAPLKSLQGIMTGDFISGHKFPFTIHDFLQLSLLLLEREFFKAFFLVTTCREWIWEVKASSYLRGIITPKLNFFAAFVNNSIRWVLWGSNITIFFLRLLMSLLQIWLFLEIKHWGESPTINFAQNQI